MQEIKADLDKFCSQRPLETAMFTSDMAQDIQIKVREEVETLEQSNIFYTDENHHTGGMSSIIRDPIEALSRWYKDHQVLKTRINQKREEMALSNNDTEYQQLTNAKQEEISKATESFKKENGYQDAKDRLEKTKNRYDKMFNSAGGKPPKKVNPLVYGAGLLVPSVPEFWMNYETLGTILNIPAFALALAFISAIVTAAAAHFHGKFLKQRLELIGPDIETRHKVQQYRVQAYAWLALISITVGILAVRYQAIVQEMGNAVQMDSIFDSGAATPEPMIILFPFIIFAIAPWFVSMFCAYVMNDAKPFYQEAQKDFEESRVAFNKIDAKLKKRVDQIEAKFSRQLEELANTMEAERKTIQSIERLNQELQTHVNGVLSSARNVLNRHLRTYHNNFVTHVNAKSIEDVKIGMNALSVDDYIKTNISLSDKHLLEMVS